MTIRRLPVRKWKFETKRNANMSVLLVLPFFGAIMSTDKLRQRSEFKFSQKRAFRTHRLQWISGSRQA